MQKSILIALFTTLSIFSFAQQNMQEKLKGLDQYMATILKDWNTPGMGVGVVVKGKLVFVKGYGYRDYAKRLPITSNTLFQIASNTKLFTSTSVGMLVNDGKLEWDKPVKKFVPSIEFYNNELNNTVTIRDMLSHRTGVSRHDLIWYKSNFSRTELFTKLKYLEPSQPLRQGFIYNNLMYAASGHVVELISNKKWEMFVQDNILNPLDMKSTVFNIADMRKSTDYFIPFNEKRDTNTLYQIPWLEDTEGLGPAGSMISNIEDMSHWLIAQMNDGRYMGKQIIPSAVIKATMEPAIPEPNNAILKGYTEMINPIYGMGRGMVSYRGHNLVDHGGDLNGIHSQISFMPQDSIGVIVFVIGDQGASLYNTVSYNIYERMLGISLTPWSERRIAERDKTKAMEREGRGKAGIGQIKGTKPSHPLEDYLGDFEDPAYGSISITKKGDELQFQLHKIILPLHHFHYDRFDTPNDEQEGLYSLNYFTNPQGEIDRFVVSLDQGEVIFKRIADASLSLPATLAAYTGKYKLGGMIINVIVKNENQLFAVVSGQPELELVPYKTRIFKTKEFADFTIEFVMENGVVTKIKQRDPSGEYEIEKVK